METAAEKQGGHSQVTKDRKEFYKKMWRCDKSFQEAAKNT